MTEIRKLAAILVADVVGYSRLAGADEDRTLARLRGLRSDLIDPAIAAHHGRIVKRTGDGSILEFRSVVDAVRCAVELQSGLIERNAGVPEDRRIQFRVGIHVGDVVEESDGDLMGDGVNIAARLEGIAKPGAICLSEQAYWQVKGRLDLKVSDLGSKHLKNIAEPIRVYSLEVGEPIAARPEPLPPEKPGPPHLSIVVLPFANFGGDSGQDYFVDGVTESLTTDLSQMSGMRVIGRNTAFSYRGKAVDLKQIGRELNVRYVLEGSVQRSANRIRLNVQLIDPESGDHLWAERFDKTVADLFDMQDEIVARLANALNAQLIIAEARRAERAPSPDSMDLYFQGMSAYNRGLTPDRLSEARRLFERARALDPDNVDAIIGAARTESAFAWSHMSDDRTAHLAAAEALAVTALSIAPEKAPGHVCLGVVRIYTNRVRQGIAELERALAIDRNLAEAHGYVGIAKCFLGRAEETELHVHNALRLSPRDTFAYLWRTYLGVAKVFLGNDEEAITELRHAIEINRNFHPAHIYLAASLAGLGRLDEARVAAKEGLSIDPTFTIRRYRADAPSDNPVFLAGRQRIYEMMRKVGIPEV
ncbi:MAG: adenylate/guanylate cyclase domain-containing protein [Hyphomicrobiales bacterium]|nr:adenylate/guanylate cyclase domain-containing protein [Hyphomicrobiales bacterium]